MDLLCACLLSHFSHVWLFETPWTIARQAFLSIAFSRHEYWSGSPCPPPGGLPNPGIEPGSPALQADSVPPEKSKNSGGVAYPFSRGTSRPRNLRSVFCIAGGVFTSWVTQEAPWYVLLQAFFFFFCIFCFLTTKSLPWPSSSHPLGFRWNGLSLVNFSWANLLSLLCALLLSLTSPLECLL